LNIFRGDFNLESVFNYNPIFKTNNKLRKYFYGKFIKYFIGSRLKSFTPTYNLHFAKRAKQLTDIPIISVGGFRSKSEIEFAINNNLTDLVGLSRPFICEPDLVTKFLLVSGDYTSQCNNCNECVYMCDSGKPTVCYSKKINSQILEVRK
jgi:2,4-dienoyl-CoA reductase-like NADH-dependent reductase (Old Yellow Enzyme family)